LKGFAHIAAQSLLLARAAQNIHASEVLSRAVLNAVMANIAVVDKQGTIIIINEGWERFALENGCEPQSHKVGVGANCLEVCERAAAGLDNEAQAVLNGIKAVLAQSQATFKHEYSCPSPTEQRWFSVRASYLNKAEGGAVIVHLNITERKASEESLKQTHLLLKQSLRFNEALPSAMPTPVFTKRDQVYPARRNRGARGGRSTAGA
jgi:nitrogen fixation/metabolism regulation signal transduction histidine kinase